MGLTAHSKDTIGYESNEAQYSNYVWLKLLFLLLSSLPVAVV